MIQEGIDRSLTGWAVLFFTRIVGVLWLVLVVVSILISDGDTRRHRFRTTSALQHKWRAPDPFRSYRDSP